MLTILGFSVNQNGLISGLSIVRPIQISDVISIDNVSQIFLFITIFHIKLGRFHCVILGFGVIIN